jgi:peptidoglycan/LPS O-acetylase OafA/YrhL
MSTAIISDGQVAGKQKDDARQEKNLPTRIPQLDGLRGLAILLVILCHYVGNAAHRPLGYWPHQMLSAFTVGWSGVDLFFVLSGFLIGGILLDARDAKNYFRVFYLRRAHRILPIYYLWTLLYAGLILAALSFFPGRYPVTTGDLVQVPIHLLFLQNFWIGMPTFAWIWFVVTWSLAVEEQFYLMMPPIIRFCSVRTLVWILSATIVTAPLFRVVVYRITHNPFSASFPMPGRADALAWGVLVAAAWRAPEFRQYLAEHRRLLQVITGVLLLGIGMLSPWLARPAGLVTLTVGISGLALLFSCLLMLVLSQPEGWPAQFVKWSFLRSLGTISYCVYILHDTFNQLAHRRMLHDTPQIYNIQGVGVTLLALAATLAVASLSWRFLEKPLIGRGHKYAYNYLIS